RKEAPARELPTGGVEALPKDSSADNTLTQRWLPTADHLDTGKPLFGDPPKQVPLPAGKARPQDAALVPRKDTAASESEADDPKSLPPLNRKVLQFARDNLGKKVGNGECATLAVEALAAAGARLPTPEESLVRAWSRRLRAEEKPLPGDI